MTLLLPINVSFLGSALDPDAARWISAVGAGNVSQPRGALISNTIRELKAAGVWSDLDWLPVLAAENAASALVDWKARKTMTAINSPTFTADRGYAFDGSTNYLWTGFTPSTDSVAATGTSFMLGAYERTNVSASTVVIGAFISSTQNLRLTVRNVADALQLSANTAMTSLSTTTTDGRGLSVGATNGTAASGYKNGAVTALSPVTLTTPGSSATSVQLFIGAQNNSGSPGGFRAASVGYALFGGNAWTAAQHAQFYNIMQRYMTTLGANV
jgi:hypothetical protein